MLPPEDALPDFWFGTSIADDADRRQWRSRWFRADPEFDALLRQRFAALADAAARGDLATWTARPRGRLALILALDQLPRNLHRGTPAAFACDPFALAQCLAGVEAGQDASLAVAERGFFYLPLQHVEDATLQARGVVLCERLVAQASGPDLELATAFLGSAREHLAVVRRFGRFPHRNAILRRASTAAERDWLAEGERDYGQRRSPEP